MKRNRRRSKGFTLVQLLIVIVVIAILMVIVIPRLLGAPAREAYEKLDQLVQETADAQAAYEQAAKILLIAGPMYATDEGWFQLAVGHGYSGKDPRKVDAASSFENWRSNLHFRDWSEVQASKLPPGKTIWGWEVCQLSTGSSWQEINDRHNPFMCRTVSDKCTFVQKDKERTEVDFERACLVLFADGSAHLCRIGELRSLGLVDDKVVASVWPDEISTLVVTYEEWQKELQDLPRRGKTGNISWSLIAPRPLKGTSEGSEAAGPRITKLTIVIDAPSGIDPATAEEDLRAVLPYAIEAIKMGRKPSESEFSNAVIRWTVQTREVWKGRGKAR